MELTLDDGINRATFLTESSAVKVKGCRGEERRGGISRLNLDSCGLPSRSRAGQAESHHAVRISIPAIDTLGHVDIVSRRLPSTVLSRLGFDRDSLSWANSLAKLAGDAALFTGGISTKCMLSSESRPHRSLLCRHHRKRKRTSNHWLAKKTQRSENKDGANLVDREKDVPKGYMIV